MSTSKKKKSGLLKTAGMVSAGTALSRVFGLVREQVMAYYFGAGMATDAFVAAFRIPNLLRDMFAEGALSSAFVPVFKEKLTLKSEPEAFALARVVATAILMVVGLIVLLGIIAAPAVVYLMAHGFTADPEKFDLTVGLTRLMMVYLLLVSLSAMVMGMLNSLGRFGIPSLAPAVFNIGVVLSVVLLHDLFPQPVYAMATGVLIGGVGQLAVQLPSLWRIGFRFKPAFDLLDEGLKKVVRLIGPMIIGMSAGRINILLSTLLASFLVEGSISYLNYSFRLMHFPLGVFAVALGTVALLKASEMAALGDYSAMSKTFRETMNLNLLVIIPSAFALATLGPDLIRLVYQWGAYSSSDAANTSLALLHYSYGLVGFGAVRVIVPFYYALGDSKLPARISIVAVGLNIALYYPLIKAFDFAGLAAATSIGGLANFVLLATFLPSRGIKINHAGLLLDLFKMTLAASLAFYTARMLPYQFIIEGGEVVNRALALAVPALVGLSLYLLLCLVFRVPQAGQILRFVVGRGSNRG